MSLIQTTAEVEYPESDGLPMGETDLHRKWMIRLCDILGYRYRDERVYVASNLLVYYEEGEPSRFVVPDDFVVKDCDPKERRVFKIWEEKKPPDVVIEVTSLSTRNQDTSNKPELYARIGVKELFLYDPTSEYLATPLQGFRLAGDRYEQIGPDETGALECHELEILLRLEEGRLAMYDIHSGDQLLTEAEAERAAREEAEARAAEESKARKAAEEELRRLRDQLKQQGRSNE